MKCNFCGAHIGKDEELCPECGKYIFDVGSTASSAREAETTANQITSAAESGEPRANSVRFNYGEYIRVTTVVYILMSVVFLNVAILALSAYIGAGYVYGIAGAVVAVMYLYGGLSKYKREKDCFVEINETTVFGTVPLEKSGKATRSFEIKLADVLSVQRLNGSKNCPPTVTIFTDKEDEAVVLYCTSKKLLKKVTEELKNRI